MAESDLEGVISAPTLRADLLTPVVPVPPGETATVEVQVLNTTPVIETVEVQVLGIVPESLVTSPARVTLFPDESQRITIDLRFHRTLPAGEHEATLVVTASSEGSVPAELPVTFTVPEVRDLSISVEPPLKVAGKKTRYTVRVDNTGNTPLPVQVRASDADKVLELFLNRPSLRLGVDRYDEANLVVQGKRPWTGAPVDHVITVSADSDELVASQEVRFRQKARITAGVITIFTLLMILLLWAAAMYFGVQAALRPEPPTKNVPESFVPGTGLDTIDPTVVGGTLAGTIAAASTAQPLPRVTIEAYDLTGELVSATATGDDGEYELSGLLPARYRLRIRADGFETQWWPGVAEPDDAELLVAPAMAVADGLDLRLTGLPGSLGGQVLVGDEEAIVVGVEVVAIDLLEEEPPIQLTTDEVGIWSVTGLTTPATYRIIYRAAGYAPVDVSQPLDGGEQVVVNPSRLEAAPGSIAGLVSDRRTGAPLGGVEVTALRGDTEIGTVTPTSGEIGAFLLEDLATPGTYLVTFALEGYASETVAVRLGPGERVAGFEVALAQATGVIAGRAVANDGRDLGGVTITVSGGGTVVQTDTFTSGDIGAFRVSGLPVPGTYTVTFDLEGFGRETVQVGLSRDDPDGVATAVLTPSRGQIVGRVLDAATGEPLGAVPVEVSDGDLLRETTTASSPAAQAGRFTVSGLAPGTYTVTANPPGGGSQTVLVVVRAAATSEVELRVVVP